MFAYEKKVVFIHIPKTGGTSVNKAFLKYATPWPSCAEHLPYLEYYLTLRRWMMWLPDFKVLAVVRNPFARLVSMWQWHLKHGDPHPLFENYVKRAELGTARGESWFRPQVWYLKDMNGKFAVPHLFKLEDGLQPVFKLMAEWFGVEEPPMQHANATRHEHYSHYYTPELVERVTAMYKDDLDHWNYNFEKA